MTERNISAEQALTTLFQQAKEGANTNISVATLAIVESVVTSYDTSKKYGTANLLPIPKWDKDGTNGIEGYFFSNNVGEGDLVLAVFTDYDFRPAVKAQNYTPSETANKNVHSKNFGIIIPL